jgi:hypothetical protein
MFSWVGRESVRALDLGTGLEPNHWGVAAANHLYHFLVVGVRGRQAGR